MDAAVICQTCGEPTENYYRDGQRFICAPCHEQAVRQTVKTAEPLRAMNGQLISKESRQGDAWMNSGE